MFSANPTFSFPAVFVEAEAAVPILFTDGGGDTQLDDIDPEGDQFAKVEDKTFPVEGLGYLTLTSNRGPTTPVFVASKMSSDRVTASLVPYDPATAMLLWLTDDQINAFIGVDAELRRHSARKWQPAHVLHDRRPDRNA